MITSLTVHNFKSWRLADLRLAPITILFGANSSGKTSILQLLLLLKQTVESADRNLALDLGSANDAVNLGTFLDMLHRHDRSYPLGWKLAWNLPEPLEVLASGSGGRALRSERLELAGSVKAGLGDGPEVNGIVYSFDGVEFALTQDPVKGDFALEARPPGRFKLKRSRGRPANLPGPFKCYGFPDQVRASFTNVEFLSDFELSFEQLMHRLLYLGPLRERPHRQYTWGGAQPKDVGQRGERTIDALLAMRARGEKVQVGPRKRVHFETYVTRKLQELGLVEEFAVEEVKRGTNLYQTRVRGARGPDVLLTDVGFGVSQALPVVVLPYHAEAGSTVILEQPEIHLHPAVQAGLADVFIDAFKVRGVQLLVESHSEHFLQRLLRRITEKKLSAQDVALYFCEREQGDSKLEELKVNELGYITNWPQGFFGDPLGEAVAMTEAAQRRRAAQQPA